MFSMVDNPVNRLIVREEGDDLHLPSAFGTEREVTRAMKRSR